MWSHSDKKKMGVDSYCVVSLAYVCTCWVAQRAGIRQVFRGAGGLLGVNWKYFKRPSDTPVQGLQWYIRKYFCPETNRGCEGESVHVCVCVVVFMSGHVRSQPATGDIEPW